MPTLLELQTAFRQAMLGDEVPTLAAVIAGDGLPPESRLHLYRHHVVISLTAALEATFPVLCRLLDSRFFGYLADAYIRQHPPDAPCLFEYGEHMPAFVATFPPCRDLTYLPDVARLEWALNVALHAVEEIPCAPEVFQQVAPDEVPRLALQVASSVVLLHSPWPIDQIWHANQEEANRTSRVDLGAGGVWLEIRRWEDHVGFRKLDPAVYAFRAALAAGECLATAAERALETDQAFDCIGTLQALLADQIIVGYTLLPDIQGD